LLKNNIQFFENYLKLLKGDKDLNDIKIEDFVKMIPKEQKKINDFNNANNKSYSQVKKKDIIEENIKAFDKSSKFSIESSIKNDKSDKYDKKLELDEDMNISNNSNSNQISNNLVDDNYYKDLIKMKFDS
jgi:hypothetical protein